MILLKYFTMGWPECSPTGNSSLSTPMSQYCLSVGHEPEILNLPRGDLFCQPDILDVGKLQDQNILPTPHFIIHIGNLNSQVLVEFVIKRLSLDNNTHRIKN